MYAETYIDNITVDEGKIWPALGWCLFLFVLFSLMGWRHEGL